MSILMRPRLFPMLFQRENVKLLRHLGRTKNLWFNHARSFASNGDNMLKTNAVYSECEAYLWMDRIGERFYYGSAFEVLGLFKSMVSEHGHSCRRDSYISSLVLKSCIKAKYVSLGRQCHGYMLKSGLVLHQRVKTALLHLYCMLSDMIGALEVLASAPQSDNWPYNMIVVGPRREGQLDEAYRVLRRMLVEDMEWNKATYIGLFYLCARHKYWHLGRQVHGKLLKSEVEFDVSICNAMIKMYGKCRNVSALDVFLSFKARNVASWTIVMEVVSEWGLFIDSFMWFHNMQLSDVAPNESTFIVMLNASAELYSVRLGNLMHGLVVKTGFKGDKEVEDALISMYLRTGDIKSVEKVFLGMTNRNIVTLNMMIRGYCLHGFGKESLALFQEMLELGEDPNYDTFVAVLNACGELRLVEEGFYYLHELMKQKGIEPGLDHYRCIINILIKARRLEEAFDFMVSTPIEWDGKTWSTLARACLVCGNQTLYFRITESIPDVSQWCGFTDIHEPMEIENDKEVEPGVSWVDIKKTTYVVKSVVKGDPRFVEHNKMMKALLASVKEYACKPDSGNVLHEIKEDSYDGYHSEKLAVAYALSDTHKAAPICIIKKSGKICDDCHSFMKVISKANKRSITVRVANGFHHFQDGSCSCADY